MVNEWTVSTWPRSDAVLVVHRLQRRDDRVGGAGGAGQDLLVRLDRVVVDAVHDVRDVALARRGQHDLVDAGAQVLRQALAVAPLAGVVDEDGVLDAVRRVVDLGRVVGVDDLDLVAVGDDRAVRLVDGDRALELAVDRVAAQQRGALDEVLLAALADDDGAQPQAVAGAGLLDEQAGDEAADAAEAVEDDVARPSRRSILLSPVAPATASAVNSSTDRPRSSVRYVAASRPMSICDGPRSSVVSACRNGKRLGDRELLAVDLAGEAVGLEDADHRLVHQGAAVEQDRDVPLPVQLPDDRDHRLRDLLAVLPVGEGLVGVAHSSTFGCSGRRDGTPRQARLSARRDPRPP